MIARRAVAIAAVTLLLAACSTRAPTGQSAVLLETYPVDGDCELTGKDYVAGTKTPSIVRYPAAALPMIVECHAMGYEGKTVLDGRDSGPWSPANVGSLGLGNLLSEQGGQAPPSFRVTMVYKEAGTKEDAKAIDNARMVADTAPKESDTGEDAMKAKAGEEPDEEAAEKPAQAGSGLPAPPGKMATEKGNADGEKMAPGMPAPLAAAEATGARVHLASYKEKSNADKAWRRIARKSGKLLAGLEPSVEQVDLGAKGKYFRVYAGMLADMKSARDLCVDLKRRDVYCRPVAKGQK